MKEATYPKRLIEVDLPIKRISAHARREKDMRLGHIPSLHIYPAARPPAACRAVICAALWPDPADPLCPPAFREAAEVQMRAFAKAAVSNRGIMEICDDEAWKRYGALAKSGKAVEPKALRELLFDFIADFAAWEASTDTVFLQTARSLTQAAHEALGGAPGTRPLVMDPFAGGGAIPLEALRVGADAFASDLNPVAVLLNKVILEYIPKYGERLAEEIRKWGEWAKRKAEAELAEFYPNDPDGAIPIAYLWARTIRCEGPGCGAEVPLMRSFWLARKGRQIAMIPSPSEDRKRVDFTIVNNPVARSIPQGTIARGSVTCPCCGYTTPVSSVRTQLAQRHGASDDSRMFAVVADSASRGRIFRTATSRDLAAYERAKTRLSRNSTTSAAHSIMLPEPLPPDGTLGFRVRKYGMSSWGHLFNSRQLLALSTYSRLCQQYSKQIADREFAAAVNACLALIVDRLADLNAAMCVWQLNTPNTAHVFGRWALQMNWDYGEVNPLAGAGGSPESAIGRMARCVTDLAAAHMRVGHVEQSSADKHPLPDDAAAAFVTDPPYYDAVPYSDLLDFFYVWLKRSLNEEFAYLTAGEVGPKDDECIVDEVKGKDKAYYEATMQRAMAEGRRVLCPTGVGVVVFAHKTTSGWEAQLQAMVNAGLTITGSWPIDTEMGSRLRAKGSAALASSVHLVCRPRETAAGMAAVEVGDWRDVLAELPRRIHEWLPRLAEEGIVGADAIFACLGPALEIFSRYARVEKASGQPVPLREYLEHVWAAVSKEALGMIFAGGDATGFEEDARLTAMWLWTLAAPGGQPAEGDDGEAEEISDNESDSGAKKATTGYSMEYDAARKIAQGLGAHLEKLGSIVEVKGETARLLSVAERTKALFGKDQADAPKGKRKKKDAQMRLDFVAELEAAEAETGGWGEKSVTKVGETVLDRLHQAMILFAAGRSEAVRRFLVDDGIGRDQRFWRLAQALSALYPTGTDEKRWVDGVLARKKGLGF